LNSHLFPHKYWEDFMARKDKQQKMLVERFGGDDWLAHISKVVKEQASENLNGHPYVASSTKHTR
jgi:hypothetical protein